MTTQTNIYFIGVTTAASSGLKLFPMWAEELGLSGVAIKGKDFPIDAPPSDYHSFVEFMKNDPLSAGAIITTHKINLYRASFDLFHESDFYATAFGEISCIAKQNTGLHGYALDPVSSRFAMQRFIPDSYWLDHQGEALIFGAGGSALAISAALLDKEAGSNVPSKIILADKNAARLEEARQKLSGLNSEVDLEFIAVVDTNDNDQLLKRTKPYSLIINATGMGKDIPGSPISDNVDFPQNSCIWELNYRGELTFFKQALIQQKRCNLKVEDGWIYFIYGWVMCISKIFDIEIDSEMLNRLETISMNKRNQV